MKRNSKNSAGFAIIETMISLAIIAVMIVSFQTLMNQAIKVSRANQIKFQGDLYLREAIEIAKVFEQSGKWDILSCTSKCYFDINGNSWDIKDGEQSLDGVYTRSFSIESINTYTKKFTAVISWNDKPELLTLEIYVYQGIY